METISLGSGQGEESAEQPSIPVLPWVAPAPEVWQELDLGAYECDASLDTDVDADGVTPAQGDCNDCDPGVGPNAVEMPTGSSESPRDEDCDGLIDEPQATCDSGLDVDVPSALAAARAIELCAEARHAHWGIENAMWVLPDGSPEPAEPNYALGHGIVDRFGPNVAVRYGMRMLALSSGAARQPTDADYQSPRGFEKGYACNAPAGFSKPSATCPSIAPGPPYDGIALELTVLAPQNAEAFAFDLNFYTYELPTYACTESDDLFVALLDPPPPDRLDGNIAFDGAGNIISVNTVRLEACSCDGGPPCVFGSRTHGCSLGTAPLLGTGFGDDTSHEGDRGATGWLTSTAPVTPGATFTLRLSIHDAADGRSDSTVLIDHFRWLRQEPLIPKSRSTQ